jgi:hypothetical protein
MRPVRAARMRAGKTRDLLIGFWLLSEILAEGPAAEVQKKRR